MSFGCNNCPQAQNLYQPVVTPQFLGAAAPSGNTVVNPTNLSSCGDRNFAPNFIPSAIVPSSAPIVTGSSRPPLPVAPSNLPAVSGNVSVRNVAPVTNLYLISYEPKLVFTQSNIQVIARVVINKALVASPVPTQTIQGTVTYPCSLVIVSGAFDITNVSRTNVPATEKGLVFNIYIPTHLPIDGTGVTGNVTASIETGGDIPSGTSTGPSIIYNQNITSALSPKTITMVPAAVDVIDSRGQCFIPISIYPVNPLWYGVLNSPNGPETIRVQYNFTYQTAPSTSNLCNG